MFKRKAWFTGITAIFILSLTGLNIVRADVPNWFIDLVWGVGLTNIDQQTEIDALTARMTVLEAENVGLNGGDLSGRGYCVQGNGRELTGGVTPGVYRSSYLGTLSFTDSSTGIFLKVRDADAFLNTSTGAISGGVELPFEVIQMTYIINGNSINVTLVGEGDMLFHMSLDGNIMYGTSSDFSGDNHEFDSIIGILSNAC
jgi:hypothetical protein